MNASGVSGSVAVKPIKSKTRKAKPVKVTRSKTGRPAGTRATKNAAKSTAKKAAGASKANISRVNKDDAGGYRLSDWDNVLLQALQKAGKPIKKNDIDGVFKSNPIVTREKLNDDMLYSKVSRVIHKLANKRGLIRKEDSEGKGFAYALTTWYDDKTGKLKPEHGS